jgi:hypothetical protein
MRPESVEDPPLDLGTVARAVVLLQRLLGPVPVLSVSVEADRVTIPPNSDPVRCLSVHVHCQDDVAAAEVGNRLGLEDGPGRTLPARYTNAVFVESRWAGWLTTPDAASLGVPMSLSVIGSHTERASTHEACDVVDGVDEGVA